MHLRPVLDQATAFARKAIRPGEVAVDATVGNGYDTVALAQAVGAQGTVYGFDVQEAAIEETRLRLRDEGLFDRVNLVAGSHDTMREELPDDVRGNVRAVMFNLGYLPGSDKTVITQPDTTVAALDAAAEVLATGGLITVVCYSGHEGGVEEAYAVKGWAEHLDQEKFHALSYRFLNQRAHPPFLVAIEKY